jgi:hypothetical protein
MNGNRSVFVSASCAAGCFHAKMMESWLMWVRKNQQEIRRAKLFCFIISAAGFIFHERTGCRRLGYVAGRSWDFIISELPVFFMVSAGISLLLFF